MVFNTKMTHVFFGGTFDPPHEGHRLVAKRCLEAFPDLEIVVVPGAHPAGVFGQHKAPKASYQQRLEMCRLGFADLIACGRLTLSTVEQQLAAPNYTWRTMEALTAAHPETEWGILLGFDQLQTLGNWQKAEELVEKYNVLAVERPAFETLTKILPKLAETLGSLQDLGANVYRLGSHGKCLYVLLGAVSEAASRVVRTSIDQAQNEAWLDPKVTDYIRQHKLYDESEA